MRRLGRTRGWVLVLVAVFAFTLNVQTAWANFKIVGGNGSPTFSFCPASDGRNDLWPVPVRYVSAGGGDVPGLTASLRRLAPAFVVTAGPALSGTLTVDVYRSAFVGVHNSGGEIEARYQRAASDPTNAQLRILQFITTSDPLNGAKSPYIDPYPNDDSLPFYWTEAENTSHTADVEPSGYGPYDKHFYDFSTRSHPPSSHVMWRAHLFLVSWDGGANILVHDGIEWGWDGRCGPEVIPRPTIVAQDGTPHGTYTTGTRKCGVCHEVHHAGVGGDGVGSEALLASTRADACTYCHVSPAVSGLTVYGGLIGNYQLASSRAHDNAVGDDAKCTGCHQVHAATSKMTPNAYLTTKILKDISKEHGPYGGSYPASPTALMDNNTAVTAWCSQCHGYYNKAADGESHVMTETLGSAAYRTSTQCVSCHADDSAPTTGGGSAFPHYTVGIRFLTQSGDASGSANPTVSVDSKYDGICIRCHRNGLGGGVGLSY